ncbi:hypothetical protein [Roseovarius pelagicus]|uniref:Invasion associated locus B (IalB) protein n=1 Tax=Roseovarius pelagicus TaxID=2980108 RepID=A0ABY6DHH9_9RHOB|nr:hypothetical protein [Roseovarius pelagicus]UXX84708.1 hypothetical protein N7U68_08760 [Roseovarius pelagicus]
MFRIAVAMIFASAIPAMAEDWFALTPEQSTYFSADWTGTCQEVEPYACTAVATIGARDDAGPGQINLLWQPWGDEGYSFTFFATNAPDQITGQQSMTIDDAVIAVPESDYFAIWDQPDGAVRMISIGEPIVVDVLVEQMQSGQTLVWDWGTGQLTVPLAGFAETFDAVTDYRKELGQ